MVERCSRTRWQFSLKSLLLLTLLVAAFFAGKAWTDKQLTLAVRAERDARKRETARVKIVEGKVKREQERAEEAEERAFIEAERALETEILAYKALRMAMSGTLKQIVGNKDDSSEDRLGEVAWFDLLKALDACVWASSYSTVKITSVTIEHHANVSTWFNKLPNEFRTKHMVKEDAAQPPAGPDYVVTLRVKGSKPSTRERFLDCLRKHTAPVDSTRRNGPKKKCFTHVTVVLIPMAEKGDGTYAVEFVWKH